MSDEFDDRALVAWNRSGRRRRSPISGDVLPLSAADRVEIDQRAAELRAVAVGSEEVRCGLTELPKSSCSHCRSTARPPARVDGKPRLFTASFPGQCGGCDRPYTAGSTIERLAGGGYAGPCCTNGTRGVGQ